MTAFDVPTADIRIDFVPTLLGTRLLGQARERAGVTEPAVISSAHVSSYLGPDGYTAFIASYNKLGLPLAEFFDETELLPVAALVRATPHPVPAEAIPTEAEVAEFCTEFGCREPQAVLADVEREQRLEAVRKHVGPRDDDQRPRLWLAEDLAASAQRSWLATGQVPRSAVTLLVGDEGIGKSLMWVWLIAFVTTGKPMPEYGIPAREPANVIVVVTEDDWSTTVRPRLEVAGVDLARVHVVAAESDGSGSPTFPDDLDVIASSDVAPALVVVDAWLDTVPAKLSVRDPQHARQALHPWKEFATSSGVAVLLLTHTNRVATANARDKYGATAELRKKARMTLFAQADSENDDCLVIGPEKSNIARSSEATRFRITSVQHFEPTDEDDGTVPLLEYAGTVGKSSREIIADNFNRPDDENANDLDAAKAWLSDYLGAHSPALSKPLKDAARKDEGISERTLKRAANELGVVFASDGGFPRKTVWSLPGAQSFDPLDDPAARTDR